MGSSPEPWALAPLERFVFPSGTDFGASELCVLPEPQFTPYEMDHQRYKPQEAAAKVQKEGLPWRSTG